MNQQTLCDKCQHPLIYNEKTGKWYCSAFCYSQGKPCKRCGAEIVYNQQYRKYECAAMCWKGLKQATPSQPHPEQTGSHDTASQYGTDSQYRAINQSTQSKDPQQTPTPAKPTPDWDKINSTNQRNIHWGESFKLAAMLNVGVSTNTDDVYQIALKIFDKLHNDAPWMRKERVNKNLHHTEASPPPPDEPESYDYN